MILVNFSFLKTLYKNYLEQNEINNSLFLYDTSKYLKNCSDSIGIDLKRINSILTTKDETSEIMILLKDVATFNDTLKLTTKKIQKNLPKLDDEQQQSQQQQQQTGANSSVVTMTASEVGTKRKIAIGDDVRKSIETALDDYFKLSKVLRELYNMCSNLTISMESGTSDADAKLTSKKLENLAFQACDKVYLKEDNGPYDNIRSSISSVEKIVNLILNNLANGDFEVEISDDEYRIKKHYLNSPILHASDNYKKSLFEAENLKYKLESKEDEIKELKKHLKLKIDELSEHKVRIGLSEKKTEMALKEMDEKGKKHQQTIDELKAAILKKEK